MNNLEFEQKLRSLNNLNEYINHFELKISEGYCKQQEMQCDRLRKIVKDYKIKNIMEIGFNAGHSAELFLSLNENINVVSFDLAEHYYTEPCNIFIKYKYPNRHQLIKGNSLLTVPEYFKKNNKKFDLIFIDGGHDYKIAIKDLINSKNGANDKTIVVMDDTVKEKSEVCIWNTGPNKAWKEGIRYKLIKEIGSEDYSQGRGQSWGNYLFKCKD